MMTNSKPSTLSIAVVSMLVASACHLADENVAHDVAQAAEEVSTCEPCTVDGPFDSAGDLLPGNPPGGWGATQCGATWTTMSITGGCTIHVRIKPGCDEECVNAHEQVHVSQQQDYAAVCCDWLPVLRQFCVDCLILNGGECDEAQGSEAGCECGGNPNATDCVRWREACDNCKQELANPSPSYKCTLATGDPIGNLPEEQGPTLEGACNCESGGTDPLTGTCDGWPCPDGCGGSTGDCKDNQAASPLNRKCVCEDPEPDPDEGEMDPDEGEMDPGQGDGDMMP